MTSRTPTTVTRQRCAAAFGERPFTCAEGQAAGITRGQLRAALAAGTLHRAGRALYAVGPPNGRALALRAQGDLAARGIEAVLAGRSAADAWGIPVLGRDGPLPAGDTSFAVAPGQGRPGSRGGVLLRHDEVPAADRQVLADGLILTSPLRTAIDVVRLGQLPRHLALPSLCAGMRLELALEAGTSDAGEITAIAQIEGNRDAIRYRCAQVLDRSPRWGAALVRACLAAVDPRLETALEALSWGRFHDAGVPLPLPQAWLEGSSGRCWRVDFWVPSCHLIGEADGLMKYSDSRVLHREKDRQWDLEGPGRTVIRWGWRHALRDNDPLFARVLALLARS